MSLPILEGDNFGKDVSVCLSPLSEQPLNLWGSLGIQLGVVAQQGDRGRREFDLFCACSCSGSFGLAPAQRGCLGSGEEQAALSALGCACLGPHGPGGWGHLGTHLCHLSAPWSCCDTVWRWVRVGWWRAQAERSRGHCAQQCHRTVTNVTHWHQWGCAVLSVHRARCHLPVTQVCFCGRLLDI